MIPFKDNNPTQRFPVITVVFIGINVLVYLAQFVTEMSLSPEDYFSRVLLRWATVPGEIVSFSDLPPDNGIPPPLTIFSGMFMHGDWMHLIGNMLFLWVFGDNIEDAMGRWQFVIFYLFAGIVAALSQILVAAVGGSGMGVPMLGASGAVAGVLGAYLVMFPNVTVRTIIIFYFIRIVDLRAKWLLGIWFALQIGSSLLSAGPGVAWWAHIGGFAVGAGFALLIYRPSVLRRKTGRT